MKTFARCDLMKNSSQLPQSEYNENEQKIIIPKIQQRKKHKTQNKSIT